MKKKASLKKIIFINLLIMLFVWVAFEFNVYETYKKQEEICPTGFINGMLMFPVKNFISAIDEADNNFENGKRISFRKNSIPEKPSGKKPILLYGCSFAAGVLLNSDETFSAKLSKYTNRIVYNRALPGFGIQHMLYHIENNLPKLAKNRQIEEPEYVIYTFIDDHIFRLFKPNDFFERYMMFYKSNKNGALIQKNDLDYLYWHSYILRNIIQTTISHSFFDENYKFFIDEKRQDFLFKHFLQSKKGINKIYQDTKFIIFVYTGKDIIKTIEKELRNNSIEIIYLEDISDIDFSDADYKLSDGQHPNAKAWEIIVPILVNKLTL